MFKEYYQDQLRSLRRDAREFAGRYPSIAPMLAGQSPDPDTERLLEGVAYLTGVIREKLDDEFPEIIHGLSDLVFPHFLRPMPSVTIMEFVPKPALKQTITIKAGSQLASDAVDGTTCLFRTISAVEMHPLTLADATFQYTTGQAGVIRLTFELAGMPLDAWRPASLRFFINEGYSDASDLLFLLTRFTEGITLTPEQGGEPYSVSSDFLRQGGFGRDEQLIPYPERAFPGYRFLQEYFLFPQKFLFVDLLSLDSWRNKGPGSRFTIEFRLRPLPFPPCPVKQNTFMLHVVPAVNIFPMDAEPVIIDHRHHEYRLLPSGMPKAHYLLHSVTKVTGIRQGSVEQRPYTPFEYFNDEHAGPLYELKRSQSRASGEADVSIAVVYPQGVERFERETLSISLECINSKIPERLAPGSITRPTDTSPELASFRNIMTPSPSLQPPLGSDKLWQFLSHLSLNFLSIANIEALREMLGLYVFPEERDKARLAANIRKVQGLTALERQNASRLVRGFMMRGTELSLGMRHDHYSSTGDMCLFASVLDCFLASYSSINAYTRLSVTESITGTTYQWTPRLGDRFLL